MEEIKVDHSRAKLVDDDVKVHHENDSAPDSSRADRKTSYDVAEIPVPTGREEDWRFTPLAKFQPLFAEDLANNGVSVEVKGPLELADVAKAESVRIGAPGDRAAVVSFATADVVKQLVIPAQTEETEATSLLITGESMEPSTQVLNIIAEERSSGTVLITHRGSARLNQTVQIDVKDDAELTIVSVQEWNDDGIHTSNHRMRVGRNAKVRHIVVTLGGDAVRLCPDVQFADEGADVEMLGAYFTDAGQHQEHRLYVDHSLANCRSRVTYKGALQGKGAHSVWIGDVLIGPEAFGTDTYELNRNLVLSEGALADSVPNLEIENGEIEGAGHASATGRFDDEQLFYLRSRGIPEATARRLVVRGFFAELITQIGVRSIQDHLMEAIEIELDQAERAAK